MPSSAKTGAISQAGKSMKPIAVIRNLTVAVFDSLRSLTRNTQHHARFPVMTVVLPSFKTSSEVFALHHGR
jgi:hypothetical protein